MFQPPISNARDFTGRSQSPQILAQRLMFVNLNYHFGQCILNAIFQAPGVKLLS